MKLKLTLLSAAVVVALTACNSTENNIIWPLTDAVGKYYYSEPGGVYNDTNPNIKQREKSTKIMENVI